MAYDYDGIRGRKFVETLLPDDQTSSKIEEDVGPLNVASGAEAY